MRRIPNKSHDTTTSLTAEDVFRGHGMAEQAPGEVFSLDGTKFVSCEKMIQITSDARRPVGLYIEQVDTTAVMPQRFCMFADGTAIFLRNENYHVVEHEPMDVPDGP